jgi:DNA-binding NarL/FixJ family response regulator
LSLRSVNGRRGDSSGPLTSVDGVKPELVAPQQLNAVPFRIGSDEYVSLTFQAPAESAGVPSVDRLTESEQAICSLARQGHSNGQIARARGTTTGTVASQLSAVYRKLDVKSRRELGCGPSARTVAPVTDPIAIIEAAYSLAGDEQDWLVQLGEAFRSNAGDDRWAVVSTVETGARSAQRSMACLGAEQDAVRASGNDLFSALVDPEPLYLLRRVPFVCTLRQLPERLRRAGVAEVRVRAFELNIERWLRKWDMSDELWVNAQDTTGISCCFFGPMRRSGPLWPREAHKWRCIAAHVATAFRVRRQFAGGVPALVEPTTQSAEAVLDPGGRLLHAEAPAQSEPARDALRRAVQALDRARSSLRRRDPDQAIAIWTALVAGRWSLIDRFDSDGRRFVVAHRNAPSVPDMRGLTLRERQVLAYAKLGHPNKVIAYEFGLSLSTVSTHLARARMKLQSSLGAAVPSTAPSDRPT